VLLRRPIPHRAVIELTRETLTVLDRRIGQMPQSWPRSELAEIRPNRYARGLYVRIPGKQNFDVLTDLSPPLLAAIGRALDEARARLDQYSPPQAAPSHLE
jgi:hypothetical protein